MKLKPLVSLLVAAFAAPAVLASAQGVVISQVFGGGGNSGATIKNDFIELFNASGSPVNIGGWSVQYASSAGSSWATTAIPAGTMLQPGRYFLINQAAGTGDVPVFTADLSGTLAMAGGTGKVALVSSLTALTGAQPSGSTIVDVVGYGAANFFEGTAGTAALTNTTSAQRKAAGCTDTDSNSADFDVATTAPRNSSTAANVCGGTTPGNAPIVPSCPEQAAVAGQPASFNVTASDSDSIVNGASITVGSWPAGFTLGSFTAAGAEGGTATQQVSVADTTAAGVYSLVLNWANDEAQSASCTIKVSVAGAVKIPAIQGSGARSPLEGGTVTTTGIVTKILNNGFYLQDVLGDNDTATSDGVFVFTSTPPAGVAVGDEVRLSAKVAEYSVSASAASQAAPLTELTTPTGITVLSSGNALPMPVEIDMELDGATMERFEGMLVTVKGPLMVQQTNFVGPYGQLTLAAGGRTLNPTNILRPGPAALALAQANRNRSIVLDDSSSAINPNPTPYLAADKTVRAGDAVDAVTGVIDFGPATASATGPLSYKIHPVAAPVITRANLRTAAPAAVGGNITVASANVLNYFTTFMNGQNTAGQTGQTCMTGCRGADDLNEFTRQHTKIVASLSAINADVVGLMEIQNNGNTAVQYLVNGLNSVLGAGTYAAVPVPAAGTGTDAIRVALIYKPGKLSLVPNSALSDTNSVNNRPTLAQGFMAANGEKFAVLVNHLKSKGSCPSGSGADADKGDLQGCWNATRVQQAQRLLTWLPTVTAAAGTQDVILLGDFNAYAMEDPMFTLANGGLVDLISVFDPADYSYVFDAFAGRLDQVIGSASIVPKITGTHTWHINADEPPVIDYNTDDKPATDYYTATAYRSSDHDPVVLGLNLVKTVGGTTSGRDTIVGSAGDDVIEGGPGADTLTGGAGRDQFVYRSILDIGDTITDFTPGQDTLVFGPLLQSLGITSADPLGTGHVTCSMSAGSAIINFDTDGSAGPNKARAVVQLKNVNCGAINAGSFKF